MAASLLVSGGPAISPSPLPVPTTTSATGSPPASGASTALSKAKAAVQSAPGTLNGPPSGNNHAIPLSARRAEPLDLTTVERRGHPFGARLPAISMPATRHPSKKTRLFGIPDAPVYRPSEDEFREPMEYIRKIAPEGSKYGIVKIIPPDTWNPSFAINTEVNLISAPPPCRPELT